MIISLFGTGNSLTGQSAITNIKLLLDNESNEEVLAMFHEMVKNEEENAELWYLGGTAQRRMMRQDSALFYYRKASIIDPDDERIATALAAAYTAMRQFTPAKEIYRGLISRDSTRTGPFIQLAQLHSRDSEAGKALEIYEWLHEREPDNYNFIKNIAASYRQLRNDPAAVRYYRMAHEMNPEDISVNIALSELHYKMQNYREGLEIAERGLEVDRLSQDLLFWAGFFNYALGMHQQAIVRLKNAEQAGNTSIHVSQYLGICYYLTGDYDKAREYLELVVTFGVNDARLYTYLGIIYRKMGNAEMSEYYFLNALSVLTPPAGSLTETYQHLIETYKLEDNRKKITDAYKSAIIYDADNPYLYYGLAYTLDNHQNNEAEALEYYLKFSDLALKSAITDVELSTLLDYANSRIRRIRENRFFENR